MHLRHALRNAALPALTVTGLVVGELLSGAVVTETVFSRAGIGRLTATSVGAQDIPVVQGIVLFAAAVFVAGQPRGRPALPAARPADRAAHAADEGSRADAARRREPVDGGGVT